MGVSYSKENMQAVLLAAGRGSRLKPLTDDVPKPLINVNGKSFIENALDALASYSVVDEAIIVVGYKKEVIQKKIGEIYKGLSIKYVDNHVWDKTNNCYSLYLASERINKDFIILEDDVFFEHRLIDPLVENRGKSMVLLAEYKQFMSGTVAELRKDQTIARLVLNCHQNSAFDFSNLFKTVNIASFDFQLFKNYFKPMLDSQINYLMNAYWEIILGSLVYLGTPGIFGHVVKDAKWFEVDNYQDLLAAKELFF